MDLVYLATPSDPQPDGQNSISGKVRWFSLKEIESEGGRIPEAARAWARIFDDLLLQNAAAFT